MAHSERYNSADAEGGVMRQEFSKAIKINAWQRAGGHCEMCTAKIYGGNGPHYDHILPDALGGAATLDNCQVLCKTCHGGKTRDKDVPRISKARRGFEKRIRARDKRRGFRKPAGLKYDWDAGRYSRSGKETSV